MVQTRLGGRRQSLDVFDTVNVFLRGGSIIPFQKNDDMKINSTAALLNAPITLIALRDENGRAKGTMVLDTGDSRKELTDQTYEYYQFVL